MLFHFLATPTAWKVSKYGAISGLYFPVLVLKTGKYGPEITPYLDTFQAVTCFSKVSWFSLWLTIYKNNCLAFGTQSENFNLHLAIPKNLDRTEPQIAYA